MRAGFLEALAGLTTVDLGGVTLLYGADDNQGMDVVFLTRITAEGAFEPIIPVVVPDPNQLRS